jgi:hypothetical protein
MIFRREHRQAPTVSQQRLWLNICIRRPAASNAFLIFRLTRYLLVPALRFGVSQEPLCIWRSHPIAEPLHSAGSSYYRCTAPVMVIYLYLFSLIKRKRQTSEGLQRWQFTIGSGTSHMASPHPICLRRFPYAYGKVPICI